MKPFASGDKKDSFTGSRNTVDDTMPFTNSSGIVFLPSIEDYKSKTLFRFYTSQWF